MKVSDFDYELPESLIAQDPLSERDASRLLVLPRDPSRPLEHRVFLDLPELLRPGDLLVFNDTRVIPARLVGHKASGGRCELLLVEPLGEVMAPRWRAMGQSSKPLREGSRILFGDLSAVVEAAEGDGFFVIHFDRGGPALDAALASEGKVPLPPYIHREATAVDRERYQTLLARVPGSAAAPTAGLHFTPRVLDRLASHGIARTTVTLHVGPGTFLPVRTEEVERHRMHEERYRVPDDAVQAFSECRVRGGRVVAVGTTAVRALESAFDGSGLRPGCGRTSIFIAPGYRFQAVDGLVTNLHLPRSTLIMLVCALAGRERVLQAYGDAVRHRYRFFSYGDAMLVT